MNKKSLALFIFVTIAATAAHAEPKDRKPATATVNCLTFKGDGYTFAISKNKKLAALTGNGFSLTLKKDAADSGPDGRNEWPTYSSFSQERYTINVTDQSAEVIYYNEKKKPVAGWDTLATLPCQD